MFSRRHSIPLVAAIVACVVAAPAASAATPDVTITEKPSNPSNGASATFAFATTEPATFECKLDAAALAACTSPATYTALAEGPHTFAVRAIDAAGGAGPESSYGWTVDTTAPTTTITQRPSNPSNAASASFAFTTSEPPNVQCQLDGGAFAPCSSPTTYSGLSDGPHMFVVRAIDAAGNVGDATYGWTVDTVAASATIGQKPANPSNDRSPAFGFTASEPSTFQCKLDAAAFAACTSPKSYAGVADGPHTFTVKATDAAGNTGTETSYGWTIDATGPTAAITQKPNDPTNSTSASFAFTASETGSTFGCRLDAAPFAPCTSPTSYTALADGPHTFVVRAVDALGNVGAPVSFAWRVDTVAPTATIGVKPTDPSSDRSPRFGFTGSEPGSSFACRLDAGAFAACTAPVTYTLLADGRHTFAVKATDAAGNTGAETSYSWTVDSTGPTATITQKPADPTNSTSATFAFTASETGSTFACRVDTAAFAPCTSPAGYSALPDGAHTFVVRAVDPLGNVGSPTTYSWRVDTVAPTATISQKPANPSSDKSPELAFTASEPSTFQCKLDAAAFGTCSSPMALANLGDGQHTFAVKATDTAGNPGAEASYTWTIDAAGPSVTIIQKPSNPSNDVSPTFAFAASETGSTLACRIDAGTFTACTSPASYAALAEGSHTFTVKAADPLGNPGPETSYTWTIDTTPPTATITSKPGNPSNNKAPSFTFTAAGAVDIQCRLDTAAFANCTSPTAYSGLADGQHTFTVRAADAAGNAGDASYVWTIDSVAPALSITQKPANPSNDSSPAFAFTAGDAATVQCKLDAAAFTPCTSPTSYPRVADGAHTFTVRGTDPAGNTAEASFGWTIDTSAPTTTIGTKPENPSKDASPTFAFTSSEPGSTFLCRLEAGGFSPCASPKDYGNLADGAHTFAVKATDAAGNTGSEASYTWTIDTVAPTVAITGKPSDPSNTSSPAFAVTASENGSALACSLDGGAFTACTSPKSYANLADGRHTFAVRATDPAGNTGTAASYSWTIETKAPTAAITAKPSDPSNDKSPVFAFSADEPSTFACRLDGAPFAACTSPKSVAVGEGRHEFTVKATDVAGNTGVESSYRWTVDTAAPGVAITDKPSDLSNNPSPSFSFTSDESGSTFACRLDEGSFAPCTSPAGYASLPDGGHTFAVKAIDAAGNAGTEATFAWAIETRGPTAAVTSAPKSVTNSSSATFVFSADEPSAFECDLNERGFEPCGSPASYYGLGEGAHSFTVRARDAAGNVGAPAAHGWTIDATAPETTIGSAPKAAVATAAATFTFSASERGTFECRLDDAPFAVCASPKRYDGLSNGQHRFEVRAIDPAGNADSTPATHRWTVAASARKASSAILAPRSGARVSRPPLLVWRKVARASYYNVQVYRGRQKVLSGWPQKARIQLRGRWSYQGRKQSLAPGTYRWYVWPGYGQPSARRYGALLGQSTFTVVDRQLRR